MARTLFGKSRTAETPYAIYHLGQPDNLWVHHVLKTYKKVKSEADDVHSRWFCAVSSPYTYGSFELGDVYRADVLSGSRLVAATPEWIAAYDYAPLNGNLADWAERNSVEVLD